MRSKYNALNAGFTFIELMTVISVIGILLAISAPSFGQLLARQRVKTVASELITTLHKARNEAITRNTTVTLAAKTGGWQTGWEIRDPVTTTIVIEDRGPELASTISGPSSPSSVTFQPSGRSTPGSSPIFLVTNTSASSSFYKCISLQLSGRPYMKEAQTC